MRTKLVQWSPSASAAHGKLLALHGQKLTAIAEAMAESRARLRKSDQVEARDVVEGALRSGHSQLRRWAEEYL